LNPATQAVLTAEVHVLPVDGEHWMVCAPLRRAAFLGNRYVAGLLDGHAPGHSLALRERDAELALFLRGLQILDGPAEASPCTAPEGEPCPTGVTLLLTTGCTLRCRYCYASAGAAAPRHMSLATAKQGIDYVAANAVARGLGHIDVAFHGGGEPTVNWEVLVGATDHAREVCARNGLSWTASLATNGLLQARQVDWIVGNLNGLTVSFDGLPEVHDANRCLPDGGPSSGRVIETMRRLDVLRFPYGVRATLTAEHVGLLPESVSFMYTQCRPRMVQVEPVYRMGRGAHAETAETEAFIDAFRKARQRARGLGGDLAFSAVRAGSLTDHFCSATQDSFCLSADGNVTSCYEVFSEEHEWAHKFFIGWPAEGGGYRFDMQRVEALRAQSVRNRAYCRDCFARWSCGGDCYHKSLVAHGDGPFQGAGRCHIIRELTKDALLEKIAESGGVVWREGVPSAPEAGCWA
jgi:uncharacterized protein